MPNGLKTILAEAKRRRVFRTTGVYLVAVWGLSQGAVEIAPLFAVPEWIVRALVIAAVGLIPVVVVLAWMFDIGRGGIVRDPLDVAAQQQSEDDIANMSTIVGGETGSGGVIVRWTDSGEHSAHLFAEEFLIGRGSDCRVRFYDPLVSRKHARIYYRDGDWWIEDLGSRNGTLVDENRVEQGVLPGKCELRVNEAGPSLAIERIAPGREMVDAMAAFPPGQRVAHVRNFGSGATGRSDPTSRR